MYEVACGVLLSALCSVRGASGGGGDSPHPGSPRGQLQVPFIFSLPSFLPPSLPSFLPHSLHSSLPASHFPFLFFFPGLTGLFASSWTHVRFWGSFRHRDTSACGGQAGAVPSLVSTRDSRVFPDVFKDCPVLSRSVRPSLGSEAELACGRPALRVDRAGSSIRCPRAGW